MTPPRTVEEKAQHVVRKIVQCLETRTLIDISAADGAIFWPAITELIRAALLRTRQDTARRGAEIVRHLAVSADHEEPCGHLPERTLRNILAENIEAPLQA